MCYQSVVSCIHWRHINFIIINSVTITVVPLIDVAYHVLSLCFIVVLFALMFCLRTPAILKAEGPPFQCLILFAAIAELTIRSRCSGIVLHFTALVWIF